MDSHRKKHQRHRVRLLGRKIAAGLLIFATGFYAGISSEVAKDAWVYVKKFVKNRLFVNPAVSSSHVVPIPPPTTPPIPSAFPKSYVHWYAGEVVMQDDNDEEVEFTVQAPEGCALVNSESQTDPRGELGLLGLSSSKVNDTQDLWKVPRWHKKTILKIRYLIVCAKEFDNEQLLVTLLYGGRASLVPTNNDQLLAQRAFLESQEFYMYNDTDAAGNHFCPHKVFAGTSFVTPDNELEWGGSDSDYDLSDVTRIRFEARGPSGGTNVAFVFEGAPAFVALGRDGINNAGTIAGWFVQPAVIDTRLRNAYQGGDLILPLNWSPFESTEHNKDGFVALSGFGLDEQYELSGAGSSSRAFKSGFALAHRAEDGDTANREPSLIITLLHGGAHLSVTASRVREITFKDVIRFNNCDGELDEQSE